MGFSYWETYNIPVSYRIWFIRRINEEISRLMKGETPTPGPSITTHLMLEQCKEEEENKFPPG